MYGHHVVTLMLLVTSYANEFYGIGLMILLVHDSSDIPTDMLKMCNYLGFSDMPYFFITEGWFVVNLLIWFATRLVYYPTLIRSTLLVDNRFWAGDVDRAFFEQYNPLIFHGGFVLLCVLLMMHWWWFFLFLRILKKLLAGTDTHQVGQEEYESSSDISEDDEDEGDEKEVDRQKRE